MGTTPSLAGADGQTAQGRLRRPGTGSMSDRPP